MALEPWPAALSRPSGPREASRSEAMCAVPSRPLTCTVSLHEVLGFAAVTRSFWVGLLSDGWSEWPLGKSV